MLTTAIMKPEKHTAVELRSLTKRFGNVLANAGVNLRVEPGTIHGIVGKMARANPPP